VHALTKNVAASRSAVVNLGAVTLHPIHPGIEVISTRDANGRQILPPGTELDCRARLE